MHKLVDRAPTSCSHTAAPASSMLKPQPSRYEVIPLKRFARELLLFFETPKPPHRLLSKVSENLRFDLSSALRP